MSILKTQYPFIDMNGSKREDLIKHYAEDEQGNKYYIRQNETELVYSEAVDVYPSKYTYTALDEKIEEITDFEEI